MSIDAIILLIQISMNAPPLLPSVTSMLIAPILKDPISVPVRADSLVMAKPAKVRIVGKRKHCDRNNEFHILRFCVISVITSRSRRYKD